MEESTVTLLVGLAGIGSTLTVSAMSLYYTAKSRVAPLRGALFGKQLDMAVEISHLQSRVRVFVTILSSENSLYHGDARGDIRQFYRLLAEVEERGTVIMPVEFWLEVKGLSDSICDALGEYDGNGIISWARLKAIEARMAKVALLSRALTGADDLTKQTIGLFSGRKDYKRVVGVEVANFEMVHVRENSKDKQSV